MAVTTYTVKRGDSLWRICSGGCGSNIANSISGSTINAKINTLVALNNIPNRNLIYVGQVIKLSASSSSGSSSSSSSSSSNGVTSPTVTGFGLQSEDTTGRAMYAVWGSWSRANTKCFKVRWRYYADGNWYIGEEADTGGSDDVYRNDTYSAPANAKKVRFSVKAISETNSSNNTDYFTDATWSTEKEYDFSNNPPMPPSTPALQIKDLTLTASIDNVDAEKINATIIQFEIVKDNSTSLGVFSATINTVSNYVKYVKDVEPGSEYKVRCRAVRGSLSSGWSDFSSGVGTKPSAPEGITNIKANSYSDSEVTAYLEWSEVPNAETYDIEYTTNKNYFGGSDGTSTISSIKYTHHEITSLTLGKEYFFRVRAVNNNGSSDWTDVKSLVLGTKPAAPTTWSSTTTAVVGEPLNLYWVHNAEDGSSQTFGEIRIYIDDVLQVPDITVKNSTDENEKDRTSVYAIDTNQFPEGSQLKWAVRTAGITKEYGDWSIQRVVDIYAKPTLEMSVTNAPDGTGDIITTLTRFPFYIRAVAGPKTQSPIGYQVKITANEFYETVDETGRTRMINKDEAIYSKYFDISDILILEMSANNIDIEANISYTISCSVTMNSGLSVETTHDFIADWLDVEYNLNADVYIDRKQLTASIRPYSEDSDSNLVEDLTLSVYRREFDGSFTEIAKDIPNSNNTTVTDPHPALDYARYRLVGKTISTGAISYYDLPPYEVGGKSVIIQWNEEWSVFDSSDEYSLEKPDWSGSLLTLPYNIDVSDNYNVDVELIKYAGRKRPVSYYGTHLGESSSWSVEIPKSDKETLYTLRRLAIWQGDVYVREPSGSGYWANISVSFSQSHCKTTIPVTLDIKRVEGGV